MLAKTGLATTGLAVEGLANGSLTGSEDFSADLVIDYPLTSDLVDREGGSDATLARTTIKNYVNASSGLLTEAAINEPAFVRGGILIEGASTNDALQNEALNTGSWLKSNASMSQDGTIDPEGGTGAWKLEATTAGNTFILQTLAGATGNSYSFWAKAGNVSTMSHGAIVSPATIHNVNQSQTLTDTWQRFTVDLSDFNLIQGSFDTLLLYPHADTSSGSAADGDYIYIYIPQMQTTDVATSDIMTAASPVTRTSDNLVGDETNLPAAGADQTIAMTVNLLGIPSAAKTIFIPDGETSARKFQVSDTGTISCTYGGASIVSGVQNMDENLRLVMTADDTNFEFYINDVLIGTDTYGATGGTITGVSIGGGAGAASGFLIIKDFQVYDRYFVASEIKDV